MTNAAYDPWDSAWNAQPRVYSNEVYGEVVITMEPVVLVKGVGKVCFDPAAHKEDERRTSITVAITPLSDAKYTDTITRDMLAESNDWTKITLPSVKSLGLSGLREINGKYVKAKLIPTGQKFTGRDGAERDKTAFSFLAVYKSEQECRAAFYENNGGDEEGEPAPSNSSASNGNGGNGNERENAAKFLVPVVENCCRGAASKEEAKLKVSATIANMPLINKYFTLDSPEVTSLIDKAMGG